MRRTLTLLLCMPWLALAQTVPQAEAPLPKTDIEGAIGLLATYEPSYSGSPDMHVKPEPVFFLRWGRFMATNAGVFVTRRDDQVMRGVSADLVRREDLRVNLALRVDNGRDSGDSDRLAGLEDVRSTVRGRLSLQWRPAANWSVTSALSPDLLGRGGGLVADAGVSRAWALGPGSRLTLGASVHAADARYMRSYYGITPGQAAQTGYAAYAPTAGWRNAGLSLSWRREFAERWVGYTALSATHLMGPAAASPLTRQVDSWALSAGLAWRF